MERLRARVMVNAAERPISELGGNPSEHFKSECRRLACDSALADDGLHLNVTRHCCIEQKVDTEVGDKTATKTSSKCLRAVSYTFSLASNGLKTVATRRRHPDLRSPCGRHAHVENCHELTWSENELLGRLHHRGVVPSREHVHAISISSCKCDASMHRVSIAGSLPRCAGAFYVPWREHNESESMPDTST